MATQTVTAAGPGPSAPLGISRRLSDRSPKSGFIAQVSDGASLTYQIEVGSDGPGAVWGPITNAGFASCAGTIDFPGAAIRVNVTNWTSGSVTLAVVNPNS